MALIARILKSFSNRANMNRGDFVGVCKCPNCEELLEVRDVNGRPLK